MRTTFELAGFAVLAVGLHLSFVAVREEAGFQGAGDGGEDLISVAAADASIEAMIQQWETPPPIAQIDPVAMQAPEILQHTPDVPVAENTPEFVQPQDLLAQEAPAPAPDIIEMPERTMVPDAPALPVQQNVPQPQPDKAPKSPEPPTAPPVNPPAAPPAPPAVDTAPPPPPPPAPEPQKDVEKQVTQQASTASAQSTARVAQGSGGDEVRGESGSSDTATVSDAKAKSLMAQWGSQIRNRIARKVPRGAGKGTANVRITVSADGRLVQVSLAKSSGNNEVDKLALSAVQKAGKFPAAPKGLGGANRNFVLPISAR